MLLKKEKSAMISPMLAKKTEFNTPPEGPYLYEMKWDGIRAVITVDGKFITICSRSGRDITEQYPELTKSLGHFHRQRLTLDAELVAFDENHMPDFARATSRLHLGDSSGRQEGSEENPVTAVLFDVMSVDGQDVMHKIIEDRKEILNRALTQTDRWMVSKVYYDGQKLFNQMKEGGFEGIMAKRCGSQYLEGRRTKDWLKVKVMYREEVRVIGYTLGLGKRDDSFGAFVVEDLEGRPVGKVGTGFTDKDLATMTLFLNHRGVKSVHKDTVYLMAPFNIIVQGMKKNKSGAIREPVFISVV